VQQEKHTPASREAPRVRKLPTHTQREIDATKFYPSFKFILKELLENSIDAGAKFITATIDTSSLSLIVTDDGHGISDAGLRLIGSTRASSRLEAAISLRDDRPSEHSANGRRGQYHASGRFCGLLGQAVQALSAVSEVSITTRESPQGPVLRKVIQFGEVQFCKSITNVRHGVGTTLQVTRLFEKQPVRRKILVRSVLHICLSCIFLCSFPPTCEQEKCRDRDIRARCVRVLQVAAMLNPTTAFLLYDHCRGLTLKRLPASSARL